MGRASKPVVSNHDKIKNRFMELFETAEELRIFFNLILPPNSLLKKILEIEKIQEKEILCDTVLSYLGDNFFVHVGTVRSDDEIIIDGTPVHKKQISEFKKILKDYDMPSDKAQTLKDVIKEFEDKSKINPTHIVREKILQQYCKYDQQEKTETKIIESFNDQFKHNTVNSLTELSKSKKFLNNPWAKDLCNKQLGLPDTILEKPETEPALPETIPLRTHNVLPRLYDFQTEALIKIHNMFNGEEDFPGQQKRLLVNLPTGAGKTRMAVQAIIEWINLYFQGECEHAHEQQKNPNGLIFWFASTNELCTQASGSFEEIFGHIGTADKIHVTNWFGSNPTRRDLRLIRDDKPGLHIVITNTIHTNQKYEEFRGEGASPFEQFQSSDELEEIRKNTIAIIVDEAHEITNTGYQNFLAAMGFNYSRKKKDEPKRDYNTQNIVLIGLTATPYKGSGIASQWQCVKCNLILKTNSEKIKHQKKIGHSTIKKFIPDDDDDDDFESEDFEIPKYVKRLNPGTRKILKTFGYRPFIPVPNKSSIESKPIAIIDIPSSGHVGDKLKISGKNSYDHYSDITYHWVISDFTKADYVQTKDDEATKIPDFYFTFNNESIYEIILFVKNEKGVKSKTVSAEIEILPKENSKIKRRGDLEDTKEFYEILTHDQKILSKITHGVIAGPQNDENYKLTKEKRRLYAAGKLSGGKISTDPDYNTKICKIVDKCIRTYNKKHVLIFAHNVKHSQELMLILRVKYGHTKAESVDSGTNPGIRRKIVKEFRDGKIPILCNFGVLTTGFDVPKIDVVLIARDVGSNALYTQMIGRGQRGPKPGGTDELWLITTYFPHQTDDSEDLKLGWEALSTMWEKFSDEIKEDLGLDDKIDDYSEEIISKPQIEIQKSDFILSHEPIMDLKLKCQSCGVISQGLENCLTDYYFNATRVNEPSLQKGVQKMLKENSYPQNCAFCRIDIPKILQKSDCVFTNYVTNNNKLDPIFILIAKYVCEYQKKNKSIISFNILKNDIKNYISDSTLSNNFFTYTHPIMEKLKKDKILEITDRLDLTFIKIKDFETLSKIISVLEENDNFKIRLKELIKKYKINNIEFNPRGYSQLDDAYFKLKKEIGHIPTKRQYLLHLETTPLLKTQFEQSFHGDYLQFLSLKGEFIKGDQYLKDLLYDEYFAKCIREKSRISHEQLDKTGDYRLEDYCDVWTTIEKFERKVTPIIDWVLEFYDELSKNSKSELELIGNDILELKRKIPSNYYHFETIRNNSSINISQYIIQLKISHLKYLKNYDGKFPTIFLQLVSDFFRLKEWINVIPTFEQFIQGTRELSKSNFMKVYGITNNKLHYSNFLRSVLINNIAPITSEQKQVQEELILNKLKEFSKQNGNNKTLELIDSKFNFENELSVQLKIYFPDTKNLKKIFKSTE